MTPADSIERRFGWRKQPHDARDRLHAPRPALTRAEAVDWSALDPTMTDQALANACVGFAVREALRYMHALRGLPMPDPSPWDAYWIARAQDGFEGEDGGAFIRSGFKAAQKIGIAPWSSWTIKNPYDAQALAKFVLTEPPPKAETQAIALADFSYELITGGSEPMLDALQTQHAPAFGVGVTQRFCDCSNETVIPAPEPGEPIIGGHALTAVGFGDFGRKVLVKNHWSKDWGFRGYCWMHRDWFDIASDVTVAVAPRGTA